jgi:hypothetical protein
MGINRSYKCLSKKNDETIEAIKGIKIRQFKDYSPETESKNKEEN